MSKGKTKPLFEARADGAVKEAVTSKSLPCRITNKGDDAVELLVYGVVGDDWQGMDARSVVEALSEAKGKAVNVRINSPGGLAYDGIAIYNVLAQHEGGVTVSIDGIAGSAASIIAMAGDTVKIAETGSIYCHRAEAFAFGNEEVMGQVREFLTALDGQIAATYAARTGKSADDMLAMMKGSGDGSTFVGQAAVDAGLADEVIPAKRPKPSEEDKTAKMRQSVEARLRVLGIDEEQYAAVPA